MIEIPIWEKELLSIKEAAAVFNIGTSKLREITSDPTCPFVLFVGKRRVIKRRKFLEYLENTYDL